MRLSFIIFTFNSSQIWIPLFESQKWFLNPNKKLHGFLWNFVRWYLYQNCRNHINSMAFGTFGSILLAIIPLMELEMHDEYTIRYISFVEEKTVDSGWFCTLHLPHPNTSPSLNPLYLQIVISLSHLSHSCFELSRLTSRQYLIVLPLSFTIPIIWNIPQTFLGWVTDGVKFSFVHSYFNFLYESSSSTMLDAHAASRNLESATCIL